MIAVSSLSFCRHPILREEMARFFPLTRFHEEDQALRPHEIASFFTDALIAVVGTEKISRDVLLANPQLKVIVKYGVGLDNLDLQAMQELGVELKQAPGVNRQSVAELSLALLLMLAHRIHELSRILQNGGWLREGGVNLQKKTIGILGFGHVGSTLASLLMPFGCNVLACDILDKSSLCQQLKAKQVELPELLAQADFISLHLPLDMHTRGMFDQKLFEQIQEGACLVNTARAEILQKDAFLEALDQRLGAAALDVFWEEPLKDEHLLRHPKLILTPHIGGATNESRLAMGRAAIQTVREFFNTSGG